MGPRSVIMHASMFNRGCLFIAISQLSHAVGRGSWSPRGQRPLPLRIPTATAELAAFLICLNAGRLHAQQDLSRRRKPPDDGLRDLSDSTRDWMSIMKAKDVMTRNVISIAPDASVFEALRLMLQHKISGLPVVDRAGSVVGIVTEGDFLRRAETGTERKRPRWLELIVGPGRLAGDYVRSHARRVDEVMTDSVETVTEDAQLGDIVALMERHRIKRVPVVRDGQVVGIVSRANLLRALASVAAEIPPGPQSDEAIHEGVLSELDRQSWGPRNSIDVIVRNGVVELWGTVIDARLRDAARVAAETVPGVKAVKSHIVWVEPVSAMAFGDPDDQPTADAPTAPTDKQPQPTVSA
jgi:CBS domain-containing protein